MTSIFVRFALVVCLCAPSAMAVSASAEPAAPAANEAGTTKTPTKAELGAMLKKCSDEADAKGLTVQKGKSEARKSYRRACMLKNGVAPRKK